MMMKVIVPAATLLSVSFPAHGQRLKTNEYLCETDRTGRMIIVRESADASTLPPSEVDFGTETSPKWSVELPDLGETLTDCQLFVLKTDYLQIRCGRKLNIDHSVVSASGCGTGADGSECGYPGGANTYIFFDGERDLPGARCKPLTDS